MPRSLGLRIDPASDAPIYRQIVDQIASLTDTTIVSPMVAYLRFEPPSTLMHWTRRAPELSATSRFVSIWIIAPSLFLPPQIAASILASSRCRFRRAA